MKEKRAAVTMMGQFIENRALVWNLARNDMKKKFAGSSLGVVWAFVQPVVTVLVYWFVFEKGLNSKATDLRTGIEVPFVLWLMSGLIPWFYFQEAVNGGTGVLVEYSYLVKKVVFHIEMLPLVKMISAFFTHLFFVLFAVVLFACMGYFPSFYLLQVLYYSLCMIMFTMGVVYITSAVNVFFRDMKEVVGIILQIGIWVTPIMWTIESMAGIPAWAAAILRFNPMYYIVYGYRDAFINKIGFWEHPVLSAVFWGITVLMIALGFSVFRKLRPHFADVL